MKKLTLKIESLAVESYDIPAAAQLRVAGTVRAHIAATTIQQEVYTEERTDGCGTEWSAFGGC